MKRTTARDRYPASPNSHGAPAPTGPQWPAVPLLSCGTLVFEPGGDLLLCHQTARRYWDIPKGLLEPGESERAAALRETQEECGLRLDEASWIDLGRFAYRPGKDLHLFAALHERTDTLRLRCESSFADRQGTARPEMDAFAWVTPKDLQHRCAPAMAAVLLQKIDLTEVLQQLKARHS